MTMISFPFYGDDDDKVVSFKRTGLFIASSLIREKGLQRDDGSETENRWNRVG